MTDPRKIDRVIVLVHPADGPLDDDERELWTAAISRYERFAQVRARWYPDIEFKVLPVHSDELVKTLSALAPDDRTVVVIDQHGGYWGSDRYSMGNVDGARRSTLAARRRPFKAAAVLVGACYGATEDGRGHLGQFFDPGTPLFGSTDTTDIRHVRLIVGVIENLLDGHGPSEALTLARDHWSVDGRLNEDTVKTAIPWMATATT